MVGIGVGVEEGERGKGTRVRGEVGRGVGLG